MRIIHWNISYGSDSAKIASLVTEGLEKGDTIICLQEVTTAAFDKILPSGFRPNSYAYSLEYRITGCDYSKAKPAQFLSFAESVETYKPDIVTMDANEPKVDHYDVSQIQFYDNICSFFQPGRICRRRTSDTFN